ncbi:ATP-dependent Clp protease ATP-binding subunit [Bacillus mexicanus]|uniref:AAA family ATPase n=1 Tax=Bacillus mexicanus TaxID=2834415 RepID=UPI003D23CA32
MKNLETCEICKKEKKELTIVAMPQIEKQMIICTDCMNNRENILESFIQEHLPNSGQKNIGFLNTSIQRKLEDLYKQKETNTNDFLTNLNQQVLKKYDPVLFRENELRKTIQVLLRKTKNNPILIGEAGVGKTAIAELLAFEIEKGSFPRLNDHTVYSLNIASLMAGTKFRGDFEEKFNALIKSLDEKSILFIDEIHLIMGAGSSLDNDMDFANLLKPYLTKGTLKVIGATTLNEFRKIEKDPAISRRFQQIKIEELSSEETLEVLKRVKPLFESHHNVKVSNDCLDTIVSLSKDYIPYRHFPDKAIDVLDESCSLVSMIWNQEDLTDLEVEFDMFISSATPPEEAKEIQSTIQDSKIVNSETVSKVIEGMTNIPVSKVTEEGKERLLNLENELEKRLIGQKEAIRSVSRAVKRSRLKIKKSKNPTVLLFAGQTGVGKTELVKALAESLFGQEDAIIRFDMSEYMEEHSTSKLIGSPPGYVGHEEEGLLTEKVRRNPYSIILLDEFEKAHHKISNLFLQVFDDGRLTDSKGRVIDFKNTLIILTSNIGVQEKSKLGFNGDTNEVERKSSKIKEALRSSYSPEFLNRIDELIVFNQLNETDISQILDLRIDEYQKTLLKDQGIELTLDQDAKSLLIEKGFDPAMGARPLARVITSEMEDLIIDHILTNDNLTSIRITQEEGRLQIA